MRPRRAAKLLNETTLARCAARNSGSRCAVSAKCPRWLLPNCNSHDAGVVDQQVDRPPVSHELFPKADHQRIFHWTNVILGFGDPDLATDFDEFMQVSADIGAYATALAEDRRVNHHDDLTSSLVEAEVDGERLSSREIASFFILLVVAGNETTRNAITHGVLALSRYPEQRDRWWSDFDGLAPTAVEEIVRWASPVVYMRRTLTQDIELRGTKMAAGDKVSLWYCSANRDESKFADPWTFDLARNPNPHLGFGGGGAHFCLGANLARREIRVAFDELRRQMPDVVATEEPARLLSQFIHGIKTLPVTWS